MGMEGCERKRKASSMTPGERWRGFWWRRFSGDDWALDRVVVVHALVG